MSPIKDLKLVYEALNKEGTFSAGDTVVGTLSFTLKDDTKVKKLVVKLKGEARVHWTEGTGDRKRTRSDFRRYFNVKEYFVEENGKGESKWRVILFRIKTVYGTVCVVKKSCWTVVRWNCNLAETACFALMYFRAQNYTEMQEVGNLEAGSLPAGSKDR